ncbi:hypothetical protein HC776_00530 [bacterium]|nr:hypothetical protein [bacterium]
MPFAIQEDMLTGSTPLQQFQAAHALGVQGVEVWAEGLHERVMPLMHAAQETDVKLRRSTWGRSQATSVKSAMSANEPLSGCAWR